MGKVVERVKKKKGRPSLLDLQRRRIQEQNENQQRENSALKTTQNHNHATPTPHRSFSRRNRSAESSSPEHTPVDDGYDENISSGLGRREKKLKLVVKLLNSSSGDQGGSDSEGEEEDATQNQKKRNIAAIGDGSGVDGIVKGENVSKSVSTDQGTQLCSKVSAPLLDKKLLLSVLDRIQKKDTYGVFSEPVDPEELPDYHKVIEHPMDFGTVKKKLDSGAYAKLEQFESDVFLICSNAMRYNAPETVYFRQARAIQELARKSFENLRQDSEGNIASPEPKRRGRPPTKNLKKTVGRPQLDRSASSDATLATGGGNAVSGNYDLRKPQFNMDKWDLANSSGRPRINDWASQYRYDHNDVIAGSSSKGSPIKWVKKQTVIGEDRRSTYNQSDSGHETSVLATFSREQKQLMTVGLHSGHGYARSLARFAADLGPVAWKMASKMLEKSLPSGVEFGPGWVRENDLLPPRLQPPSEPDAKPSSLWPFSIPPNSAVLEIEKVEAPSSNDLNPKASQPLHHEDAAVEGSGMVMSKPQGHQKVIHPGSNGFNSSLSYNNIAGHMGHSLSFHHHPNHSPNKEDYNALQQKSEQQKHGSAPPDLNIRFNSPTSPSFAARGELAQPDLALQL